MTIKIVASICDFAFSNASITVRLDLLSRFPVGSSAMYDQRLVDQASRDCGSLPSPPETSAGYLFRMWSMPKSSSRRSASCSPSFSDRAVDDARDENILPDRQSVEQHEILKDKTEFFIADLGKLVVVQVGERLSAEFDISFLKWNVAGNTI